MSCHSLSCYPNQTSHAEQNMRIGMNSTLVVGALACAAEVHHRSMYAFNPTLSALDPQTLSPQRSCVFKPFGGYDACFKRSCVPIRSCVSKPLRGYDAWLKVLINMRIGMNTTLVVGALACAAEVHHRSHPHQMSIVVLQIQLLWVQ